MHKEITLANGSAGKVPAARHDELGAALALYQANILSAREPRYAGRDSGEAFAFLVSQLAYTEAQVFERQYQPMQYETLLDGCISTEAGQWADSIRYQIYDYTGQGKRTSGKGKDINLVDVAYADKSFPVLYGNIGYDYTQEELRRTAFLRSPLSERRMAAAMEGYRRHMNSVALYGEAASGITGLFNNPNVPQSNAPTGSWATATPDQIVGDINTLISTIWSNTAYNDLPTDIVMAPTALSYIAGKRTTSAASETVLSYVQKNNIATQQHGEAIRVMPGFGLDNGGAGGTRRMLAYVRNPLRLVMHIPLPLRFLAPQLQGLSVEVPSEYKYSGVEIRYPKSAAYSDGI